MLLCMLEGGLSSLEVSEVMRRVLCKLEAVDGNLCLLEVLGKIRRVLLCMLEPWRMSSVC